MLKLFEECEMITHEKFYELMKSFASADIKKKCIHKETITCRKCKKNILNEAWINCPACDETIDDL